MPNVNTPVQEGSLLKVTSSPHVRTEDSIQRIMLDVIIAMVPAIVASCVFFGFAAISLIAVCVIAAVAAEALCQKVMGRRVSIDDLSAVVTGILLAFNLPAGFPLWKAAIGAVFSIVVVKQLFGGLGSNFMNPALAGRAFLLAQWGKEMTATPLPFKADTLSGPTPLAAIKAIQGGAASGDVVVPSLMDLFLGKVPGMLGEVSAAALLLGAIYLLIRGVIQLRIPLAYIGSFAVFTFIFGMVNGTNGLGDIPYQILSGGLILGAFFMATDYASSPVTSKGQLIFGLGAGFLTALIRNFGGYPEGVSYAILLMNVATPLIDKFVKNKTFGRVKDE